MHKNVLLCIGSLGALETIYADLQIRILKYEHTLHGTNLIDCKKKHLFAIYFFLQPIKSWGIESVGAIFYFS